jgi:glyoxylase-like metal-dependent hydrolase (beta-lactamase superfamily II)
VSGIGRGGWPPISDLGGGVHRITHPLPWALDHVHCYAIAADDGWTLVDSGLGTPGSERRWREALAELGSPPVARVVLTHYHPDHLGGSAALARLSGAGEVVQGALDAELTRRAWGDLVDEQAFERHLEANGMPAHDARASWGDEADIPVEPAAPTLLVHEGDVLELGGEAFEVLVLPGDADGHIVLRGSRSGRLFGGDVLLEEITPNVGRWEDTAPDPLGRYLATLERLAALAPAVVYPGHRRVIDDAPRRAREIAEHHALRLDAHHDALRAGADTAYDVALLVWSEGLGFHERRFALVEAISHLERLAAEGRAERLETGRWRAT